MRGCFFDTDPRAAFERNRNRSGRAVVPAAGLFGTYKRLQPPTLAEGFEYIDRVAVLAQGGFVVSSWPPEPADSAAG